MPARKLILASSSPRRRELLAEAGYRCEVVPPSEQAETSGSSGESPPELVARLAYQKAADVVSRVTEGIVIGCDTVAEWAGQVLGKPQNAEHARQMLQTLSGQEHRVYSGLCVWPVGGAPSVRVARSTLRMEELSPAEIDQYIASGAWQGKAGAFGYQDRLAWIQLLEGTESNVVGLPMELLAHMLDDLRSG